MADFNQSPASQITQGLTVPSLLIQTGSETREWLKTSINFQLFSSGITSSITLLSNVNSSGSLQLPTTGQIWPSGFVRQ